MVSFLTAPPIPEERRWIGNCQKKQIFGLPGRGILAADESNGTMSNRLEAVGVEASSETRRAYRANLFSTEGYESAISGVILFDETIRQTMKDGTPIPSELSIEILPGIKVDTGAKELPIMR